MLFCVEVELLFVYNKLIAVMIPKLLQLQEGL